MSDMVARDVSATGMKLEWAPSLLMPPKRSKKDPSRARRYEDTHFRKGRAVKVEELFYDDSGSPALQGKILWARQHVSTKNWLLGVHFQNMNKKSRKLLRTFRDFLTVVQSSTPLPHGRLKKKK